MPTIPIDQIRIENRSRRDPGDIQALANSIAQVGLLHPPVVTTDFRLVAGERRLAALRLLGWAETPANVAENLQDAVLFAQAETEENTCRKDLAPDELVAQGARVEGAFAAAAAERKREHGGTAPGRPANTDGKFPAVKAETRDQVGAVVGVSGKTYEKAKAVVKAAEEQPEAFGQLAETMSNTGKVDRAYKAVKQVQKAQERSEQAKQIEQDPALMHGDFRVAGADLQPDCADLVFTDPPYDEDAVSLYRDLSGFAARVLKPGGLCLAYSGHAHLPEVMQALASELTYGWTCAVRHTGGELRFRNLHVRNAWKPVMLYYRPPLDLWWDWFSDMTSGGREKDEHEWQQAEAEAAHFIEALCPAGGLVVDPFAGGGTSLVAAKKLGMRYIGFEIAEEAYNAAQVRLAAT